MAGRPIRPATRHSLGEPLPHQQADRPRAHQEASCDFGVEGMSPLATCGINSPFGELSPTSRQIAHVLRTRSPLDFPCITTQKIPFDLHVLSTPPAFVLSQNQTLRINRFLRFRDHHAEAIRLFEPKRRSAGAKSRSVEILDGIAKPDASIHFRNPSAHSQQNVQRTI